MTASESVSPGGKVEDVVVCGGGLAGLLLARQIRRELPALSVTVIERSRRPLPQACHKVGESTVETGSQYLERLGLRDYLLERHYVKLGLRFFPGGGHLPLARRTEIGPSAEPIVRSYQLDRGRFESDVRGLLEHENVTLLEGARVTRIALGKGGDPHTVDFVRDDEQRTLSSRWVVDATGRTALLRKDLKLKRGSRHEASAGWFRIVGRLDPNALVPSAETSWHTRPCGPERWRSTNHFMGHGYWAWLIPLASGYTSVGLVVHDEVHDFGCVSSLDGVLAFLAEHEPILARALQGADVRDFLCLRKYSHGVATSWSPDRWAIVGEAGAFVDPLYSPGTDFIAFANCFTVELLKRDAAGDGFAAKAASLNAQYRAFVTSTTELFRTAAPVYGHARAMTAKIYWDNFTYWSYTCQYFRQELWTLDPDDVAPFDDAGRAFVRYSSWVCAMLRAWAELLPSPPQAVMRPIPAFPSVLVDAHIASGRRMTIPEARAYVEMRVAQAREIVVEYVLRIVQELGPDLGARMLERAGFAEWDLVLPAGRIALEEDEGVRRRHQLPDIARDVERNLGPVLRHESARSARELLLRTPTA